HVVAGVAEQRVLPVVTVDVVVAGIAEHQVVAAVAGQRIVARRAVDRIVGRVADGGEEESHHTSLSAGCAPKAISVASPAARGSAPKPIENQSFLKMAA